MARTRRNPRYLRDAEIPRKVEFTSDLADAVYKVPIVIMAVPAKAMSVTAKAISGILRTQSVQLDSAPLVLSAAKGLDPETGRLMSQVLSEALGERAVVGALSGPNIAIEVAEGLPTATVIGCADGERGERAMRRISGSRLRAYTNDDVVGVEVGGAMKNVIAIAAGIGDGMDAGDNAKAALMTRGLAEMTRLGAAMGARARTFAGLTGLGDLIVTCSRRTAATGSWGSRSGRARAWRTPRPRSSRWSRASTRPARHCGWGARSSASSCRSPKRCRGSSSRAPIASRSRLG